MRRPVLAAVAFRCALVLLATAPAAFSKEPPNQHDPCSAIGKDTCGTTGVGFYTTYRYGLRWFGDYKGAVPDEAHTFCIDLQYWYPSASYRYREDTAGTLVNRDGQVVGLEARRRIAYAIWAYGRSDDPARQAAVMLYVHSQIGDARPGEVDPAAIGHGVSAIYERVARDSARLHGPYRIVIDMPGKVTVGEQAAATIRVLSSAGNEVPNVELALDGTGIKVASSVSTGADGSIRVQLVGTTSGNVRLTARSEALAATLPKVFKPTTPAAARNGQRLAAPSSQIVTGSHGAAAGKAVVKVSSNASPTALTVGGDSRDKVTIAGAGASFKVSVTANVFGPFRSRGSLACDGTPAATRTWQVNGAGTYTTPAVKLDRPGWYVYQQVVPGDDGHIGATTPCTDPKERVQVLAQPTVHTVVSSATTAPGTELSDKVTVTGLAGETVTVQAVLYGPFASVAAINCKATPVWSGTISATADGDYQTAPVKLTVPGFYSYRESIPAGDFVRAVQTACTESAETSIVPGAPQVHTQVSNAQTRPGSKITDKVVVTGLGALAASVHLDLFGPFQTPGGISCSGTPHWSGSVAANGDGTYTTQPATLDRVGYYVYRESIAEAPQYPAFTGACAESAETTIARAEPTVTTVVSNDVVFPGAAISDRVTVKGLGKSQARIEVSLYGPFPSRSAVRCAGKPYWQGTVVAQGDGTLKTPAARLAKAGFYTYHERLVGGPLIAEASTTCADVAETSLARPLIITGRNDSVARVARVAATGPLDPLRVRLAALGIDAQVFPAGISISQGVLAVPANIHRLGWWSDGMSPGATSGSILIAGHVDSATAGAGALLGLRNARAGERVEVTTRSGRTFTYRVVSVQRMLKAQLPASVYSRTGRPRLVLVTCGGPFDASIGHYRDNIVVTAVPL